MFSQNKRDQWSKKSVVGAVNVIRVSLLWNDRKRKKVWAHSCFFCSSLGTFEFWLLFFLFVVGATGFEKRWHLTASQGSWFSVSKHSIFFHCHEMLVLKGGRTFWATQVNRKWRKDRLRRSLVTRNEELARRPCGTADLWWDQNYPENNRLLLFTFKLSIHFWFF